MASISETGHAKNVATFEDLISFCTGYGVTYNPSKVALKLPGLTTQLTAANAALQAVKTAKTTFDNATNAREISFKPLKSLATKVVSALAATEATPQVVADVKSINNKIQVFDQPISLFFGASKFRGQDGKSGKDCCPARARSG